MKPEFLECRNSLEECPKCGKHSLAQRGEDKYQCLWCGFYRDLSAEPEGVGMLFMAGVFVMVLIVSLGNQTTSQTIELNSPDLSNVPALRYHRISDR